MRVHLRLGARIGFPLQWAVAPAAEDEAGRGGPMKGEIPGCRPRVVFRDKGWRAPRPRRDPYGQPLEELLRRSRALGGAAPDDARRRQPNDKRSSAATATATNDGRHDDDEHGGAKRQQRA
eukprot:gene8587-8552_t